MPIENQDLLRPLSTLQQINQRHREFWDEQSRLMQERITDFAVLALANDEVQWESTRLPLKSQTTWEQAVADAERRCNVLQSAFSRKGGTAPKHDALQDLIETIFCACRRITPGELLRELRRQIGQGVIERIEAADETLAGEGPRIHYEDEHGKPKTASVSGLKDRLARLKKNSIAPTG